MIEDITIPNPLLILELKPETKWPQGENGTYFWLRHLTEGCYLLAIFTPETSQAELQKLQQLFGDPLTLTRLHWYVSHMYRTPSQPPRDRRADYPTDWRYQSTYPDLQTTTEQRVWRKMSNEFDKFKKDVQHRAGVYDS